MPQEAVMIAVDNSDYMRNGDFNPTRLQAQTEAVMMVCHAKRQANIENSIGLMAMASKEVLSTLSADYNKLLPRLHKMTLKGNMEFCTAIRIAHLSLKLRQARHQKMRIVAFVGSPIEDEEKELVALSKRLRKEKVSVDVINFGEDKINSWKLQAFIDALNGSDGSGSHLVTVPAGAALSQSLMSSPIVYSGEGAGMSAGMGYEMEGADDPDLLYALRVSMEDQRMRQEAESGTNEDSNAQHVDQPVLAETQGTSEEAMLQRALSMSLQGQQGAGNSSTAQPRQPSNLDFASMSEEEQIAYALHMSLAGMDVDESKPSDPPKEEKMDEEFLEDLVKDEDKK
ncbi:26S proteasome non-ATPase regulatory subunit 4 [Cichlidogyrus casuarinus]|uniref:26S proteasome non-ATPase regulatory subunit 4 n=1 Tax=Cichlidogyrus casuarinus TaxID=1844966 RepID=A0ABD2QI59_9PLAT